MDNEHTMNGHQHMHIYRPPGLRQLAASSVSNKVAPNGASEESQTRTPNSEKQAKMKCSDHTGVGKISYHESLFMVFMKLLVFEVFSLAPFSLSHENVSA